MANALLEMRGITKVYPNGVVANKNVEFSLREGEIHAIAGENGAGKSTLMKIMFGMESPSEGGLYIRGEQVKLQSPQDAIDRGIGMVHQHFMLVPSLQWLRIWCWVWSRARVWASIMQRLYV